MKRAKETKRADVKELKESKEREREQQARSKGKKGKTSRSMGGKKSKGEWKWRGDINEGTMRERERQQGANRRGTVSGRRHFYSYRKI